MEEILDQEENETLVKYSDKAFRDFIFAIAGVSVHFLLVYLTLLFSSPDTFYVVPPLFILISMFFGFRGFIRGLQSFIKKELRSAKKYFEVV